MQLTILRIVGVLFLLLHSGLTLKEQGPAVSCNDEKKKLLCLPEEYSKFDLPYRNEFNVIDIGTSVQKSSLYFLYSFPRSKQS